jgi:hypothetical protein
MHEITNQRMPHLQANCTLAPRGNKEREKTTGFIKIRGEPNPEATNNLQQGIQHILECQAKRLLGRPVTRKEEGKEQTAKREIIMR